MSAYEDRVGFRYGLLSSWQPGAFNLVTTGKVGAARLQKWRTLAVGEAFSAPAREPGAPVTTHWEGEDGAPMAACWISPRGVVQVEVRWDASEETRRAITAKAEQLAGQV